jgi:hypothetical protein
MDEQEVASAIGWMMVASAALALMLASLTRFGYRATTVALARGFASAAHAAKTTAFV